jgi:hypothetical protein
MSSVVVV